MKIGFLLCSPDISGGTNVIFEHACGLKKRGHDVSIVTQESVAAERYSWHRNANLLHWLTFATAVNVQFDCLLATWWESPYFLHLFKSHQYAYFVQSIESKFFQPDDPLNLEFRDHSLGAQRADNGYFFSLPIITEAKWICTFLQENYNHKPCLVRNGIRKELYEKYPVIASERKNPGRLRVLVEGPVDVFHKNVPKTIDLCRRAGVGEVWLLTSSVLDSYPGVDRVFSQVPIEETPSIYGSCDLLVKLSYVEGMFGPPLEMFHCGGTALVYDVTGHDEYIQHNKNGLVVKRDDEEQVVKELCRLQDDKALLERLLAGARETAQGWPGWQQSTDEFMGAIEAICGGDTVSRVYLEKISKTFVQHQRLQLLDRDLQRFANREFSEPVGEKVTESFSQAYLLVDDQLVQSSWCHYPVGKRVQAKHQFELPAGRSVVRVDPSVGIGLVHIFHISVCSVDGVEISVYSPTSGFEKLYVTGTSQWLKRNNAFWLIESVGNDPQIILPAIELHQPCRVTISLELMEQSFREELEERVAREKSSLFARLVRKLGYR